MTDVKELFEMVTKQAEPDLDSWEHQEDRQRRSTRNEKLGAFAVAAVMVTALAAVALSAARSADRDGPATGPSTSQSAPATRPSLVMADPRTGQVQGSVDLPKLGDLPVAVSPDGREIAYSGRGLRGGLFVVTLSGTTGTVVDHVGIGDCACAFADPSWSPDGRSIAYARISWGGSTSDLYVLNVSTGRSRMLTQGDFDVNPAWSPDGTKLVFNRGRSPATRLGIVDVATGKVTMVPNGDHGDEPDWSPSGDSIAFVRYRADDSASDVWTIHPDGSEATKVADVDTYERYPTWSADGSQLVFSAYGVNDDRSTASVHILTLATGNVATVGQPMWDPVWAPGGDLFVRRPSSG